MLEKLIDKQYRHPTGLLGLFIGNRMAQDHRPENLWTVSVLKAQPTDKILELGFGAGFAIQELAKVVTQGRIAGVDYSKMMVRAACWRNAELIKQGRADLRWADASTLPFEDNTFDKAFSIHSIYFWPHPLKALAEVRRVLKPDGLLALTILPKEKWNIHNPELPVGTPDCRPYSGNELTDMLLTVGFSATRVQSDSDPVHLSNYCVIGVK